MFCCHVKASGKVKRENLWTYIRDVRTNSVRFGSLTSEAMPQTLCDHFSLLNILLFLTCTDHLERKKTKLLNICTYTMVNSLNMLNHNRIIFIFFHNMHDGFGYFYSKLPYLIFLLVADKVRLIYFFPNVFQISSIYGSSLLLPDFEYLF